MVEIWIESEQEMSAVACHNFLRNEMNLFWISWNLRFDDAEALDYTFACFDKVLCLHRNTFSFFPFQRQLICFVPEFLFCKYLLNFFQILYKMQVIVEMPVYAFMFASLS